MYIKNDIVHFAATDLASHINCQHLTELKLKVARKELKKPVFNDPTLDTLREKGQAFEESYLEEQQARELVIVHIDREDPQAREKTLRAMKDGADLIYQAKLDHGIWYGWADFLIKTPTPSKLGNWSYEVADTKLAKHTKAGSVLQICLYSYIIGEWQGLMPEFMHIQTPEQNTAYRVDDFMAYFRLVQHNIQLAVANQASVYPDPVVHCEVCDWWDRCNKTRRDDDHLSFIAGMGSAQIREVRQWNVHTLEAMATLALPLTQKPLKGSINTFTKLREQARLQLASRNIGRPVYELLELKKDFGFYQLHEPTNADVYLDFEGDPYVGTMGREYLFGWVYQNHYHHIWATTEPAEKKAFEDFTDSIMAIWEQCPGMHIYHFGGYEESAMKRLMGKYATRETEIDNMLRAGLFVDLHSIVRQALRAGMESYSLKELEKYHGFTRNRELRLVSRHKMLYEALLEVGREDEAPEESVNIVRDYNEDDCRSTVSLQRWLEKLRAEMIDAGADIPRPEIKPGDASERITEHQKRIQPLIYALLLNVPMEDRNDQQQARWLLANMLDWYRREQKSFWWEYYRLCKLPVDELLDERVAVAGLNYTGKRMLVKKSVIDTYTFPVQETDVKMGDTLKANGETVGTVEELDIEKGIISIKRGLKKAESHPEAVFVLDNINQSVKEESLIRFAEWVIANGLKAEGEYQCGRDLLLRSKPRINAPFLTDADPQQNAVKWVNVLHNSVLPIQGPPGTGKSHTAADMIIDLVKKGKKIGITALGHKVIHGLLEKVRKEAASRKIRIKMVQKVGEVSESPAWEERENNDEVLEMIADGEVHIAAGTPFMWSRPEFAQSVDYMFVDEAGQLSLIDTLALSQSAHNLILLGDPQQLKQPQKGSHPEGTELSALEHILQAQKTIQPEQGVFLDKTWRLHPSICRFNSELFYESRLMPNPENANQRLEGNTPFEGAGLHYVAVEHEGNKNCSDEEVDRIKKIVKDLTKGDVNWVDKQNKKAKLGKDDILVIAPYNAQVHELQEALPGVRVGTVDKFQGQEAPVLIFSMATSSPEDAPRGMEFLYSLNRLNVAVSRAKVYSF